MSRPMNVFGSATLIWVRGCVEQLPSRSMPRGPSSPPIVSMYEANSATAAMTAEPIAKPLVTALVVLPDRVEAHHDALGLALELARHLGDAGRVVGDRTERVLGDDDTGRGEHAHAGEGDEVERELDVAAAEPDRRRRARPRWR